MDTKNKESKRDCEIIKAWADGAKVQWRHPRSPHTPHSCNEWADVEYPSFNESLEWRVKPDPPSIKYQNYLLSRDAIIPVYVKCWTSESEETRQYIEQWPHFLRWLDEEKEIIIEE